MADMRDALILTTTAVPPIDRTAACLRALGHADRLRIVAALSRHASMTVSELGADLCLPQTRISQHLAQLREVGLVSCKSIGKWREYRLAADAIRIERGAIAPPAARRLQA